METARAVRARQSKCQNRKSFSARLPVDVYNHVSDWAWSQRMTFAMALTQLIMDGLQANGVEVSRNKV